MLIDTHAHLWFDDFRNDLEEVLARAKVAGVEKIVVPGTDIESSRKAVELAGKYSGVVYAAVGVHPEEVESANTEKVRQIISENKDLVVAVGEVGIDLYAEKEKQTLDAQKKLLREQCELALEFDLPVIIHTRNSLAEALEVLDALPKMPRGQFHCFSHDEVGIKQVLERGFHVSFCGNITWSKRVAKLVSLVSDDRLLLETDSPFMNPGKRNEPANVKNLAGKVAELREQTFEQIAELTTANAIRLFRL